MGVRVRKRTDDPTGAWWAFLTYRGKRAARLFGPGKSAKALADQAALQWRAAIARGDGAALMAQFSRAKPARAVPTFTMLAEEALSHYTSLHSLRAATLRNHRSFLTHHLLPYWGSQPVVAAEFTELALEKFIADRRTVLADSTLVVGLATLKVILRYAVKRGLLPANPLAGERLWMPRPPDGVEPFTSRELRAILSSAYQVSPVMGAYVQMLAQTGMRPGEGLALRRRDVDLATGIATVDGTWARGPRGYRGPTKTPSSVRSVSLLHPVAEESAAWSPSRATDGTRYVLDALGDLVAKRLDDDDDDDRRLFPMSVQHMARLWTRTISRAGVPYRKPHGLRHSWMSLLLSRRAPILYLVRAGGWKNATVPLRVYARWVADESAAEGTITPAIGIAPATAEGPALDLSGKYVDSGQAGSAMPTGGTTCGRGRRPTRTSRRCSRPIAATWAATTTPSSRWSAWAS